jgi:hypothetical protein
MLFSTVSKPTSDKSTLGVEITSLTCGLDTSRDELARLLDHQVSYEFDSAASIAFNMAEALLTDS